ncbi:MAG: histone deacetylase [bacterium]|nr:histone deacetylase [Deltaproteobacteria bacterium]MCP4907233.1 histone deacetylase [bacterium]
MPTPLIEIVEDTRYQSHRGPEGHPERPKRLIAIGEEIATYRDRVQIAVPREATEEEILYVHERNMLEALKATRGQPAGRIDADTYFTPSSYDVARLAVGGTVDLALRVFSGEVARGLSAVRPPGHHAEADRSMGFCLFNNIAVAIRALQAEGSSPRILVFDWDVHHGNGTQHCFESDPDVLYISTHQFPFYPGSGDFGEDGEGRGLGTTLNIPMPAGCGDVEYVGVIERLVVPAALGFAPDIILVSCGFDAHRDDPLASMEVSLTGYRAMASTMRSLADILCEGRIVHVLEGGYSLSGVREGARAVLDSLTHEDQRLEHGSEDGPRNLEPGSALRGIVDRVVEVHGRRIPNLGAR